MLADVVAKAFFRIPAVDSAETAVKIAIQSGTFYAAKTKARLV